MPANLPPDARKKYAEVEATKNPRERIKRMEEFLSLVPKHKGTAKTCAQVKKQMSSLRKEIEEKKKKKAGKSGPKVFLEKEGAAQIVLMSLTKSGKSSLLRSVTNSKVEVSPNPYTTREPVPGIMEYEDLQFQIIEAPALMPGAADGRAWGLQTLGMARNADGLIIVIDLSQEPIKQLTCITDEMNKARISTTKQRQKVDIERKYMGAGLRIVVLGRLVDCTFKEVDKLPVIAVSAVTKEGLNKLGETLFRTLEIIRIYTKEPNEREYSKKPFILKKGATIYDLAKALHSDFKDNLHFPK